MAAVEVAPQPISEHQASQSSTMAAASESSGGDWKVKFHPTRKQSTSSDHPKPAALEATTTTKPKTPPQQPADTKVSASESNDPPVIEISRQTSRTEIITQPATSSTSSSSSTSSATLSPSNPSSACTSPVIRRDSAGGGCGGGCGGISVEPGLPRTTSASCAGAVPPSPSNNPANRCVMVGIVELPTLKQPTIGGYLPNGQMIGYVAGNTILGPAGRPVLFEFQLEDGNLFRQYYCLVRHGKAVMGFVRKSREVRITNEHDEYILSSLRHPTNPLGWILNDSEGRTLATCDGTRLEWEYLMRRVVVPEHSLMFAMAVVLTQIWKRGGGSNASATSKAADDATKTAAAAGGGGRGCLVM